MPNFSDVLKLRAALGRAAEQLPLPGMRALSGVEAVPGKPGMYYVDPTKMRGSSILDRAWNRNFDEEKLVERLNPAGTKATGMLQGALETLQKGVNKGIKPLAENRAARGVVQVDENGNIIGAAAINQMKANELLYPDDLDFTRQPTNYLDFISSLTPKAKGADMARALQDAYGPRMVFQVYNPEKNIPLYRKWGAKPLPKNEFGEDVLGGGENLPAYEITDPIESATSNIEDNSQMRLPFAEGGVVPQRSIWNRVPTEQHIPRQDKYDETIEGLNRGLINWVPNAAGTVGDVIDALSYAAQKVGRGQSQKSVPSLGAGAAIRRSLRQSAGLQQPSAETSIGSPYEPSGPETFADVVNPLMFINPSAYGRAAIGGVKGLGMLGAEAIARGIESGHPLLSMAQPMSVVKPKGGQWLSGSVEDALSGLIPKAGAMGRSAVSVMDELNRTYLPESLASMSPETRATVENAFSRLVPQVAIQNWIEGPLTKYVKTRMASPDDEVRKLAEQGVLHYNLETQPRQMTAIGGVLDKRQEAGFPAMQGTSRLAQNWEAHADAALKSRPMSDYQNFGPSNLGEDWVQKLDPKTSMYMPEQSFKAALVRGTEGDLGFGHLIDELRNALNPESGLPRHLQLTPEAMKNLSMEKAVRRVHDINDWRAAQQVEANRQIAEKASTVREYPHSEETPNPKGLRWVELKEAEAKLPEGYTIHPDPKNEGYVTIVDPQGRIAMGGATEREALGLLNRQERRQALQDQLKYEGDVMGHCVGGYCDDVLSGKSRIFSLRDAKGEPHVTIEVAPEGRASNAWVPEGEEPSALPSIVQVKGKGNAAPKDEYQPFVQDFIKNSPLGTGWADVGDLHNTGLRRAADLFNPDQYKMLTGKSLPEFMTPDEAVKLQTDLGDASSRKFASGGSVKKPFTVDDLHGIIASLEAQAA